VLSRIPFIQNTRLHLWRGTTQSTFVPVYLLVLRAALTPLRLFSIHTQVVFTLRC
jgi:hypothetical protein